MPVVGGVAVIVAFAALKKDHHKFVLARGLYIELMAEDMRYHNKPMLKTGCCRCVLSIKNPR